MATTVSRPVLHWLHKPNGMFSHQGLVLIDGYVWLVDEQMGDSQDGAGIEPVLYRFAQPEVGAQATVTVESDGLLCSCEACRKAAYSSRTCSHIEALSRMVEWVD